jgi:hypothetical protein
MVHVAYLQPFEDVNKRVARLAAKIPPIKSDLCPLSFVDVREAAYILGNLGNWLAWNCFSTCLYGPTSAPATDT